MSRYCAERNTGPILNAAAHWRDVALLNDGSVFSDKTLWTVQNLEALEQYFVKNLNEGDGNFKEKLHQQLEQTGPAVKQLCAEMLWMLLLAVSNVRPLKKREIIGEIWDWSAEPLPASATIYLSDEVLTGVGSGGTGYNNYRWRELTFFINAALKFKRLSTPERSELLKAPWNFAEWLQGIPDANARQFRHMFLFLLFPDEFERLFGLKERRGVALGFSGQSERDIKDQTPVELDRTLRKVRTELEIKYGKKEIDFYESSMRELWQLKADEDSDGTEKNLIPDLINKFLNQGQTGTDLTTREYPNEYKELKIAVSFGKGNIARILWIAFLGPEQKTSDGIYPVLLYYREKKLLILAYGISETNAASSSWGALDDSATVQEYFKEQYNSNPDRYGESFVAGAFKIPEELDIDKVTSMLNEMIDLYKDILTAGNKKMVSEKKTEEETYTLKDALEGLFIDPNSFKNMVDRLRSKQNLIIQGPPGVGKTFFARRLAYALIGAQAKERYEMVQFHSAYAYEDFIQGYRPGGDGFSLKDGLFYRFCQRAQNDPGHKYVFVIDEINRGNLGKVFGELMMLIEADKRGDDWAISLTYSDKKFSVPKNLYLLGLMNTADRSLAMVDYALRRRFAFIDLEPGFETTQFASHMKNKGASDDLVRRIKTNIAELNEVIASDRNLGAGFRVGHSFFCPNENTQVSEEWYRDIVASEILPLLREYWFDDSAAKVDEWKERLLRA
jgi:MoxR-like ATPase